MFQKIKLAAIATFVLFQLGCLSQNVGINSSGIVPDASAVLDLDVTNSGLLIPRLTTAQRDAINGGTFANALFIFNTTDNCMQIYNGSSSQWENVYCFSGCSSAPIAPVSNGASNIGEMAFVANWAASPSATTYFLDVSTASDFSSFISGFENRIVGNVTSYQISGLSCNTIYYYRIRAGNSCGESSSSGTIIVSTEACLPTCGTQTWAGTNVNIGTLVISAVGGNMTSPGGNEKYCYNNLEANCTTYGALYEWNEMMNYTPSVNCDPCGPTTGNGGVQGICPSGFHIPSDLEWSRYEHCVETAITPIGGTTLNTFQTNVGMRGTNTTAGPGAKLKVTPADVPGWAGGTNASGFSALPGGFRNQLTGAFLFINSDGHFWTATEDNAGTWAFYRGLNSTDARSSRTSHWKEHGFPVRCLRD